MYYYEIEKGVIYIPIHLNEIAFSKVPSLKIDMISGTFTTALKKCLSEFDENELIILDFKRIQLIESRCFKEIRDDLLELKVVYLNVGNIIYDRLALDELKVELTKLRPNDPRDICYIEKNKFKQNSISLMSKLTNDEIENKVIGLLAKEIYKLRDDSKQPLESSRIRSNMYVNIKPLSLYPQFYKIAVYYLAIRLVENLQDENVILISSSHNGAILCDTLEDYVERDSYHFINLGPQLCLHNRDIISALSKNDNYFLIYDFICLGTEFKTTEAVLNAYGKKLVGGLGIASLLSLKDKKVHPLFYVNEHGYNYEVEVETNNENI